MHITSLPGPHGSGDLGTGARQFVQFLSKAGQTWWQILPVVVPAKDGCPYKSISSLAGSPYLISLEDVAGSPEFAGEKVDFPAVHRYRENRLRSEFAQFTSNVHSHLRAQLRRFCAANAAWLDDFALFRALQDQHAGRPWTQWDRPLRARNPAAIASAKADLAREMDYHRFVQFLFRRQWRALRNYAHERGVGLMGDVPIFVAHDSADVWCNQELFDLEPSGRNRRVSGVPPDLFCPAGQRWGHPQYRWAAHQRTRFRWWVARLKAAFDLFDAVRLDHFLGFARVWSIPASARTAKSGRWVRSPGEALFAAVRAALGNRPMIAEDLGLPTPAALRLRDDLGMPGMRIVQFGFASGGGGDPASRPHALLRDCVAYTGTHDNQTIVGWYNSLDEPAKKRVARYAALDRDACDDHIHRGLIRSLMASPANTVILPMQDVLGLGDEARMNTPGTTTANWAWRMRADALNDGVAADLREMVATYDRLPATPP
jgi:4-alpha-glucanotransferase